MRIVSILFLALFAASPGLAIDHSLARVKKAGKLIAACDLTYPPMAFENKAGEPDGFSVDFAKELGRRIGVKTQYMVMNWDGILAGLNSRRYDAIICTMNITKEREQAAAFVEFVRLAQVFVTAPGVKVHTSADLAGKTIAVQADTTSYTYAAEEQRRGAKIKEIKAFKLATDTFAALKAKQADVIVVDEPVGRYYAKQEPQAFTVAGQAMAAEPVGVALHKADVELKDEVAKAVIGMKQDGTFKRLSEKWFGAELGQL